MITEGRNVYGFPTQGGVPKPVFGEHTYTGANDSWGCVVEGDVSEKKIEPLIDINPKAAQGTAKLPLHLWPAIATAYGSIALTNGGMRYGYGNYKASPISMSIYLAAILRHTYALIENQEFDEVDGTPHIGAILANCAIILEARAVGTLVDDRPMTGGYLKEAAALTGHLHRLQEMYKDRSPRHFTVKDNPVDEEYDVSK